MSEAIKKFFIPKKYFAFDKVNQIQEISKPLLDQYAIIFVDFARIYFDGSWIFFTGPSGITQYFFESGFTFLPHVDIKKTKSFHLLSLIEDFKTHIPMLKENFHTDNLFAYVEKSDHYVDVYWFGAHYKNTNIVNFYFNNLDIFEKYASYFRDKAKHLMDDASKDKIIIPSTLKEDYDAVFSRIKLLSGNQITNEAGNKVKMTSREFDCLRLIAKGYTNKMIADCLSLSSRTVETHLDNIKLKLNCRSKNKLLEFLLTHPYQ